MSNFTPGDKVYAGNTLATVAKVIDDKTVVILIGLDSRIVDPVTLRKAE